jgi:hypothetical protein
MTEQQNKRHLTSPCIKCAYGLTPETCKEYHGDEIILGDGDRIETGLPLQGGGLIRGGRPQTVLWIDSSGIPWYRAKWGKVDKQALCYWPVKS